MESESVYVREREREREREVPSACLGDDEDDDNLRCLQESNENFSTQDYYKWF